MCENVKKFEQSKFGQIFKNILKILFLIKQKKLKKVKKNKIKVKNRRDNIFTEEQ